MPSKPGVSGNGVTSIMEHLGFHSVNLMGLLGDLTNAFGGVVSVIFSWVYLLGEIGILVGALIMLVGAATHHKRAKATGAKMLMFSVIGFIMAVVGPGVLLAIDGMLHT